MTLHELYRETVAYLGEVPDYNVFVSVLCCAFDKRRRIEQREHQQLDDEYLAELTAENVKVLSFSRGVRFDSTNEVNRIDADGERRAIGAVQMELLSG